MEDLCAVKKLTITRVGFRNVLDLRKAIEQRLYAVGIISAQHPGLVTGITADAVRYADLSSQQVLNATLGDI